MSECYPEYKKPFLYMSCFGEIGLFAFLFFKKKGEIPQSHVCSKFKVAAS